MFGIRLDHLLAGTALVLVLSATGLPATAAPDTATTDTKIEAPVAAPEPATPPPHGSGVSTPASSQAASPEPGTSAPSEPAASEKSATASPMTVAPPAAEPAASATTVVEPSMSDQAAPVAAQPAAVPQSAAAAPTLDQQVADQLRTALGKAGRKDKTLEAFYAARNFAPLWAENGIATPRAKAATAFIARVDADGLDPADYPLPEFEAGSGPATLADAELKFSTVLLTYARHASMGRVHWSRVSADVYYPPVPFEAGEVLGKIVQAQDIAAALDQFNPQQPGYKALKAKLAEARGINEPTPIQIAPGPVLRIVTRKGRTTVMDDPRVPRLRERLGLEAIPDNTAYDQPLADAVKAFQRERGLTPNGQLTKATVEALNGPRRDRVADIILANMERWRWLPHDLGDSHVMLNIPDYTLKVVKNGAAVWHTRVVVGLPSKATPILTETMKYITVNPTWNVPPSIIYNEYLPALQRDPTVLDRMGLKLTQNRDGSVHVSQPPGERNALGRIRFNFPNKFLVYQHDTPTKHLFAQTRRAYSHGCMRVQDPAKYAEILLNIQFPDQGWTQERVTRMYGTGERDIKFPNPIPVHITYQTAFVDDDGKLQIRDDVYGRDSRLLVALKSDERKVADIPIERAQPSYSRPPVRLPERYAGYGRDNDGPSFFERLFGFGQPEPAPFSRNRGGWR